MKKFKLIALTASMLSTIVMADNQCIGTTDAPASIKSNLIDRTQTDEGVNNIGQSVKDEEKGGLCEGKVYEVKSQPIRVYRMWDSNYIGGAKGTWWTLDRPTGKIENIRNNIELLNKLKHTSITLNESKLTQIIKRIDRASLTMKHLSETLLWLSRDITEPLPKQEVDLELLVKQTNSEMVYLLNNKVIDLTLLTQSHPLYLAEIPARIILGNLIRNAFQHTTQGQISIQQSNNTVIIINPTSTEDPNPDLGFGLGLQLTKQLADKLGWSYKVSHSNNIYRVEVKF